ncbi:hypothetical protein V1478_013705 [Vespula squamosa]|uniref:Uncharacterized protein n=1 Tax=Vespula squamosa TaxID=30214 RepID=A0ABD2A5X7_VESSQ
MLQFKTMNYSREILGNVVGDEAILSSSLSRATSCCQMEFADILGCNAFLKLVPIVAVAVAAAAAAVGVVGVARSVLTREWKYHRVMSVEIDATTSDLFGRSKLKLMHRGGSEEHRLCALTTLRSWIKGK